MKVLIAEDDFVSRLMLTKLLTRWGYEVTAAENGEEAWEYLQHLETPTLALLDWMMPGLDGLEVVKRLRSIESESSSYVILLTSRDALSDVIEGLRSGADDYLAKPYDSEELQARMNVGRRIVDLQSRLIDLSNTDALTGVGNRRKFFEAARAEIYRGRRYNIPLSLIMIDLDHFKQINDTCGHEAGDNVLRGCAQILSSRLRASDVVCRIGGDEFAVLLPHTALSEARLVAEAIRVDMVERHFSADCVEDETLAGSPVTLSMGISRLMAEDSSADDLYRRTDEMLYQAKNSGRNQIVVSEE